MLCLGIETSCDDTGLALNEDGRPVDSLLASQADLHAIFGGVVPELASRQHSRFIGPLFDELMRRNGLSGSELDVIAVARGPGLLGSLLTGCAFAKGLAFTLQKSLIGINHLHAHLLAIDLAGKLPFPALGLVASGGHTEIFRMQSPWDMKRLGRTLDDAAGEVFDKTGSFLGLPYPAGRQIDELASSAGDTQFELPLPYIKNDNLDFSFSGLKTAAIGLASDLGLDKSNSMRAPFCRALNTAIARTLRIKAERALKANPDIEVLCLAGGVAANTMIRKGLEQLMREYGGTFLAAPAELCMDNGAMIAHAGYLLASQGYSHGLELEAVPRGRPIPDDARLSL